jgi:hypothetical protein
LCAQNRGDIQSLPRASYGQNYTRNDKPHIYMQRKFAQIKYTTNLFFSSKRGTFIIHRALFLLDAIAAGSNHHGQG